MKNQTKCIGSQTIHCEQSLVFQFMRVAKWVALFLLTGIGAGSSYLQLQRNQEVNWVFFGICLACGVILFWIGHTIMKSECATKRRCGTCNKEPNVGGIPVRQL
ncbi:hypothetical protein [Thiothrix nivea]|uniref:Uncharacterized protein n=1 Tax=Thiothrix nivea (strain ATCC 35100 / DSM 5205 / JP2) TaxID=870187 RepID=A0A656HCM5_THINJ|nr:hypothetical protein [Thiothrix nivea]EIJ33744.1 hypothetical protein Thini_1124 [Thiothrix nivea DSM 5205]